MNPFQGLTEAEALEALEDVKEKYGWDEDNKVYLKRQRAIERHYTKLYGESEEKEKKPKGNPHQGKIYDWNAYPVKVVKSNDLETAKSKHQEVMKGRWAPDRPGGSILKNYKDKKNVAWKRYIVHQLDGEVVGWRAVFYKQKEIHYQRGLPANEKPPNDDEEGEDEETGDGEGEDDADSAPAPAEAPARTTAPPKKRSRGENGEAASSATNGRPARAKKVSKR